MAKTLTVALIYDFDGTLSPGNMQEYDFLPAIGKSNHEFWDRCNRVAEEHDADPVLTYMYEMLHAAKNSDKSLRRDAFIHSGRAIELYQGVQEWFGRINAYAAERGITLQHYINSSGLKEMIEGTPIAGEFRKIYASTFFYDVDGVAFWPALGVNYTNKTQFIFKINKGIESVYDSHRINEYIPESERPVQFRHMIYFGDGTTDIPCMKLVKQQGGHSIAVYNPESIEKLQEMTRLIRDDRASYICAADYRPDREIDVLVRTILEKIAADDRLSRFVRK
ncbi:MAG: HAD family hydrolase [Alistipes sp.]|nr:HAD family hydrolase [Alistipes sp.]